MRMAYVTELRQSTLGVHVRREMAAMRRLGHTVDQWNGCDETAGWSDAPADTVAGPWLAPVRAFLAMAGHPALAMRFAKLAARAVRTAPRPDCVVACGAGMPAYLGQTFARLWRVPFFVNVYGPDVFQSWEPGLAALCRAAGVMAPSELVRGRADMLMRGSNHIPTVLHEGVPDAFLDAVRPESTPMRLVFIGRIVRTKGLHVLLDALPEIRQRIPEIEIRVLGDGPLRPDFERFVVHNGLDRSVTFLGDCSEDTVLVELLQARAACVPSVHADDGAVDGIPVALLEAMAAECPVIASDAGGIPEVVENFKTGRLVPAGDMKALAETVPSVMLAAGSARKCAQAGRTLIRERFRLEDAVRRKVAFMEEAVSNAAG